MKNEELKKKLKSNQAIIYILLIALLIRIIYVIGFPIDIRQHDVIGDLGHLGYILKIYEDKTLPDSNAGQFYQPPLHHLVSAAWLSIMDNFIQNQETLYESLQFLTVIYSMLLIIVIYKILKELRVKGIYQILVLILMAFHPTFIILSGSINNDLLSVLFIFYTIYRLIKWYKCSSFKNIIILAISTGLAVMSKTSGAIISIPIIYIFLLQFYRSFKKAKLKRNVLKKYIGLFLTFGIISLSIGLWFPIRNYILFRTTNFICIRS